MASPALLLPFLLLLLLLNSHRLTSADAACQSGDRKTLLAIRSFLGSNPYILPSWLPATDCCGWAGIICDGTGRVTTLSIYNEPNISTTIPPAVANLTSLVFLTLGKLNLVGPITPLLAGLPDLISIDLGYNRLSGQIPSFLTLKPKLQSIILSNNRLTGSIPPGLSSLPVLVDLNLAGNLLTGPIPDSFGRFRSLYGLYLSRNKLSGPVPRSLASADFFKLDLSYNQLNGDASFLFHRSDARGLQLVDLSYNNFEFDLGPVVFPPKLKNLYVNNNKIYGSIPQQITTLRQLSSLNVSYNALCGKIPTGGRMGRFRPSSYLSNRCLCGTPLPPCK